MKYFRRLTRASLENNNSHKILEDHLVIQDNDLNYDFGLTDFETLFHDAKGHGTDIDEYVHQVIKKGNLPIWNWNEDLGDINMSVLLPIYPEEIWAAGVTYSDSMRERQAESETPDVYAKVYGAERPEIFFKGTSSRMQGPFEKVGIRKDSGWDVPESELAVLIVGGEIAGYLVGNDMSSRSIEGENPLYLPQAKIYNKSCSIGPCIVSVKSIGDPHKLGVSLKIFRDDKLVFDGESSTSEMKRNVSELSDWLQRHNDIPDVTVLLTGTGIIPPQDFTLNQGDIIKIGIEKIGYIQNEVVLV